MSNAKLQKFSLSRTLLNLKLDFDFDLQFVS